MHRTLPLLVVARVGSSVLVMIYAGSLPYLVDDWRMSATEAGAVQSAFNLSYAISLFLCSLAADRVGPRRIFAISNWVAAIAFAACALFAKSFDTALCLFSLLGLALGGSYTPALMLVARIAPRAKRGMAMGWILTGSSLGYFIAIAAGPTIVAALGYRDAWFIVLAFPLLAALAGSLATRSIPESADPASKPGPSGQLRPALLSRRSLLLTGGYTAHSWELLGMWAWAPAFLTFTLADGLGVGTVVLGLVIAASLHVSGAAATLVGGIASDRYGSRAVLVSMGVGGALCSLAFGWSAHLGAVTVIVLAILYGFLALGDSGVFSSAMTEAVPEEHLGTMFAMRSIMGFGAGALSPLALGYVLDLTNKPGLPPTNWGWAFAVLGIGGAIAAACAAALPREKPCV